MTLAGIDIARRKALEDELQSLEREIPYREHELTYGYGTHEELAGLYARVIELREALEMLEGCGV